MMSMRSRSCLRYANVLRVQGNAYRKGLIPRQHRILKSKWDVIARTYSKLADFTTSSNTPATTSPSSSTGLFSIPQLKLPSDFLKLASDAMSKCNSIRQTLNSQIDTPITSIHQASETLFLLDSISRHVCNVIDAAELCRCVHPNSKWRDSAANAFTVLSDYIGQLNADTDLYRALTNVTASYVFQNLSEEQQRFGKLLQKEFEQHGIHLPDSKRDLVCQVQSHVVQLESLFQNNITNCPIQYFHVDESWLPDHIMPRHVLETFVPQHLQQHRPDGTITLSTESSLATTIKRYSPNSQLRKQVYYQTMTTCPENLPVLEALRAVRHELAVLQGFPSYAHRVLCDKMAQTPETVDTFLNQLQQRIRRPYQRDMESLVRIKQYMEGTSTSSPGSGGSITMEPWDMAYYTGILKSQNGTRTNYDAMEIANYFTIPNCLEGMKLLVLKLFGITMKEIPKRTSTTLGDHDDVELWDPEVRKFIFLTEQEELLGTMYLDLYPRPGKYVHAAHFTVLCGCADTVDATTFQRPVIALVCNLTSSSSSRHDDGIFEQNHRQIVAHSEVETLFHEFGHALHSLLSRTTFQHMSGTRAAMDFVELPSQFMENFVWDATFLKQMAFHADTGQCIPEDLLNNFQQSRFRLKSLELQNQIVYAKFDQLLFGPPIFSTQNTSPTTIPTLQSSTNLFAQLHHDLHIPYAAGTHWHSRFGHLVTYGAGYYGYLYSETFACDVWQTCFANSLSRKSGERLWQELLAHGGARDPRIMLRSVLGGRDPSEEAMFKGL